MRHVVQFSGGVGSWAAAKRVAGRHGTDGLVLLFADTKIEDPDLYRFVEEAAANVGGELVKIEDGRDPWEVFRDVRYLGNTMADPCSRVLKRELLRAWIEEHGDPESTDVYLGIDWTEAHRMERAAARWEPWRVSAPLCEAPYLEKPELLEALRDEGIRPPRLYAQGFPHNNCGGFCVKAGQAQFELLLRVNRPLYLHHEEREQDLRAFLGEQEGEPRDVAILRDRTLRVVDGKRTTVARPLTLREFRERLEDQPELFDHAEWGACGCAVD